MHTDAEFSKHHHRHHRTTTPWTCWTDAVIEGAEELFFGLHHLKPKISETIVLETEYIGSLQRRLRLFL